MSIQDLTHQPVSAFVVAVGSIDENCAFELEGTAFLIGKRGFMMTAAHVAEVLKTKSNPVAIFMDHTGSPAEAKIIDFECHPTEDVAIIKLLNDEWASIHDIIPDRQFGSLEVMMWSYPESVARQGDEVKPDLIYFQGYIRRLISRELPVSIFRGSAFYEVSHIGGACASGSPITIRSTDKIWHVVGIYVGELTSDTRREVGIAVRSDAFSNWIPAILGNAISAERHTHTSYPTRPQP